MPTVDHKPMTTVRRWAVVPPGTCTRVNLEGLQYTSANASIHCAAKVAGFKVTTAKRGNWLWVFRGAAVEPTPDAPPRQCCICSTLFHHRNPRARLCGGMDCRRKYDVIRAQRWRAAQ